MGFPLHSNEPYIKDTGERTTLGAALSAGGGGEPYTLPTASSETKGGVKIGSGLTMTGEVLSADAYSLPTASADTLGGVKVGSGLSIADGVLSATGGSGGGGGHLYRVTTSNSKMSELYIFLASEMTINNAASLLTAVDSGLALITKGAFSGTSANIMPIRAYKQTDVNNKVYIICKNFAVADNAISITVTDTEYVETSYISSVISSKIY